MVEKRRYSVLKENQPENQQEKLENNCDKNVIEDGVCKKHGIWCRIKTRLRLKKRKSKKQGKCADNAVECSDKHRLLNAVSQESILEAIEEARYKGRTVHITVLPNKYKPLNEFDDFSAPMNEYRMPEVVPEDDHVAIDDENAILTKENKRQTLKDVLVKKWKGKNAKRMRKEIRHGTRNSIKYLQTGTMQLPNILPDANSIANAAMSSQRQHPR